VKQVKDTLYQLKKIDAGDSMSAIFLLPVYVKSF